MQRLAAFVFVFMILPLAPALAQNSATGSANAELELSLTSLPVGLSATGTIDLPFVTQIVIGIGSGMATVSPALKTPLTQGDSLSMSAQTSSLIENDGIADHFAISFGFIEITNNTAQALDYVIDVDWSIEADSSGQPPFADGNSFASVNLFGEEPKEGPDIPLLDEQVTSDSVTKPGPDQDSDSLQLSGTIPGGATIFIDAFIDSQSMAFADPNAVLLGDVDLNGVVDFFDIAPFITVLVTSSFQFEADINEDGNVDFADISPFIAALN